MAECVFNVGKKVTPVLVPEFISAPQIQVLGGLFRNNFAVLLFLHAVKGFLVVFFFSVELVWGRK